MKAKDLIEKLKKIVKECPDAIVAVDDGSGAIEIGEHAVTLCDDINVEGRHGGVDAVLIDLTA